MANALTNHARSPFMWRDPVWTAIAACFLLLALFDSDQLIPTLRFSTGALLGTAPFILFAITAVGVLKASGAETLIAKAFVGSELQMIVFAALLGGLSPFCSCEVIPFIAALLVLGIPLSAVMAFWLASPLMDPAMFLITSGTLGWDFAIAKAMAAIGIGTFGGLTTMAFSGSLLLQNPLREAPTKSGCCGGQTPFQGQPLWSFWRVAERRDTFIDTVTSNGVFLFKWLSLAYVLEALMLHYIPASWIAGALGGNGLGTIALAALVGVPAYLNGYAAVPLVDAMLTQGMSPGAAMSFIIAGGVTCIPAAVAVWALVKPKIFIAYLVYAAIGAVCAGGSWHAMSLWLA